MLTKREFYFRYGAEEFYIYNPDKNTLEGYRRTNRGVTAITDWATFVSPRLSIRFELVDTELHILGANGQRFLTFVELGERAEQSDKRAKQSDKRADDAERRLERMRAKMLAAGLDPDADGT